MISSHVTNIVLALSLSIPLQCQFLCQKGTSFLSSTTFTFKDEPIDVVIPSDTHNRAILELCIDAIRKYGQSVRDVYVISPEKVTDKAYWVDENIFPFDVPKVATALFSNEQVAQDYLQEGKRRTGWYLQQLLKLYAPLVIPGISSHVLLLDSDVIFLAPVAFMNSKNEPYFCPAREYFSTYFKHGAKLIPGFRRMFPGSCNYSGISHHMLIQRPVIEHFFRTIESRHHMPAWQAICEVMDLDPHEPGLPVSGFSEYELYFNYIFAVTHQAHIRYLVWQNVSPDEPVWSHLTSLESPELEVYRQMGYAYIARH